MKLINETFDNDLLEIRVSQNLTKLGAGGGGVVVGVGRPIKGERMGEKWSKLCTWGGRVSYWKVRCT